MSASDLALQSDGPEVRLSLPWVRRALGIGATAILILSLASETVLYDATIDPDAAWPELFNLGYEVNLPTWYSSMLLLTCSLLLFVIYRAERARGAPYRRHWAGLSIVFLYISLDEAVIIHEMLNGPLREAFGLGGVLYFAWVLPVGLLLLLFFATYLRFLFWLPRRTAKLIFASGAVYATGAMGTELPVSLWYDHFGGDNVIYGLMNAIQETMEIIGASMFCFALVAYLGERVGSVSLAAARD